MIEETPRTFRHSRRRFLQVAGATGFTVAASGLGDLAVAQTPAAVGEITQAPFFEGQELPPVAERVSEMPLVVQPHESVGQFGGTLRSALYSGRDYGWLDRLVRYENLVNWSPDWQEVVPNIAHAYEVSDDARAYTFHLRPGMKWSDGEPFTSADVEFFVNYVYLNEKLSLAEGSNPFSIEVQDDVTFTVTWEKPNGFALAHMCEASGNAWTRYPRHYMEQFHIDFNPDGIDALIEEAGVDSWVDLFWQKGGDKYGDIHPGMYTNPELPRLHAWQLVAPYTGEATRVTFIRNPYYWKVDPDGQQLPYIDECAFDVLSDPEVVLLRTANGDIDFLVGHSNTLANKPVLAESRESGNYEFFDLMPSGMNTSNLAINLTHKDEAKREIFQNKDFRIGMSHAVNRQEIIDVVYVSQGEPWQLAPRRESNWFNEELAKQYTEYDVDLANEHLDKVLPDKDGDGMRLMPSGDALTLVVECDAINKLAVDSSNLVVDYWRAVGINATLKPEDRALLINRAETNDIDCMVWGASGGLRDAIIEPNSYFPYGIDTYWGIAWGIWYSNISRAEAEPMEPPEDIKQQMDLYDQISESPDPAVQDELFRELLAIHQENFYSLGVSLPAPEYGVKSKNLKNVPAVIPWAWIYPSPAPTQPEQYYFEGGGQQAEG